MTMLTGSGEFFGTRVQLGGRLFSTEDMAASSAESTEEKIKSMKVAAAASFSGWGVSVDVSASHGKGSESKETKTSSESVYVAGKWWRYSFVQSVSFGPSTQDKMMEN